MGTDGRAQRSSCSAVFSPPSVGSVPWREPASYRRRTTRMVPVKAERNGLGFLPLSLSSLGRIPGGRPPPPPRVTRRIALFTNNTNKELLLAVDAPVRRITQPVPTRKDVKGTWTGDDVFDCHLRRRVSWRPRQPIRHVMASPSVIAVQMAPMVNLPVKVWSDRNIHLFHTSSVFLKVTGRCLILTINRTGVYGGGRHRIYLATWSLSTPGTKWDATLLRRVLRQVLVAAQTDILDRWKRSDRTYRFLPSPFPLRRGDKTRQRGTASRSSKTHKFFSPPRISIFAFSSDPNRKIFKKSLRRGHRIRTFTFLSPQEILLCIFIIIGVVGPNRKYEGHLKVRHLIRRECNHSFFLNMYISLNFLTHQSMFHSL